MTNFAKFVQEAKRLMNVSPDVIQHGRRLLQNPDFVAKNKDRLTITDQKAMQAALLHDHILPQIQTPQQAQQFLQRLAELPKILQRPAQTPQQQPIANTTYNQTSQPTQPQQKMSFRKLATGQLLRRVLR